MWFGATDAIHFYIHIRVRHFNTGGLAGRCVATITRHGAICGSYLRALETYRSPAPEHTPAQQSLPIHKLRRLRTVKPGYLSSCPEK
jgi:hypothetical protein